MHMNPLTKVPEANIPMKNSEPPYASVVIDIFSKMEKRRAYEAERRRTGLTSVEAKFQEDGFSNVNIQR